MNNVPNREARQEMSDSAVKYGVDALLTPEAFVALLHYVDDMEATLREACVECREHAAVYDSWRLAGVAEKISKLLLAHK